MVANQTDVLAPPVDRYLDRNTTALEDCALALLRHDTQNPPGTTRELVDSLTEELTDAGVSVRTVVADQRKPNLVATVPGGTDHTLCLNGHLDTVPFDGSNWSSDPLGEWDGTRLYGRGATDMKGAVAGMLQAMKAYAETGTEPPVTLALALVSDEERNGDAGLPTLQRDDDFDPDACVIGETTARGGRCSVAIADRGSIWLTLTADGTAAHGSRPMLGDNAVDKLYTAIDRLRREFGTQRLDIDAAVEPILEETVEFYAEEADAESTRELFETPSLNLGVFEGGDAVNAVPDSARARLDIRLTASVETPEALSSVRHELSAVEGVTIVDAAWSRGTYEPRDSPLVGATVDAAATVTDDRIFRRSATGGGDAKKLRRTGIPTVEFGFGTQTAHAVDEYTTVEALQSNARAYAALPVTYARRL